MRVHLTSGNNTFPQWPVVYNLLKVALCHLGVASAKIFVFPPFSRIKITPVLFVAFWCVLFYVRCQPLSHSVVLFSSIELRHLSICPYGRKLHVLKLCFRIVRLSVCPCVHAPVRRHFQLACRRILVDPRSVSWFFTLQPLLPVKFRAASCCVCVYQYVVANARDGRCQCTCIAGSAKE